MAFISRLRLLVALSGCLFPAASHAQSFDCGKAQSAIEKAICASPALIAQDTALAASYRQALADLNGDPTRLNDLRQQQRRWLADRNKSCVDTDPGRLTACLATSYQTRLEALVAAGASPSRKPPESAVELAPSTAPTTQPAAAQDTSAPAAVAAPQPAPLKAPPRLVSQPHLAPDQLPADQDGSTLLTVDTSGHITIRTQSTSGVALQLVDMIAGPGDRMGAAGVSDGRIDALLDKGTYKVRVFGAKGAAGDVKLTAQAYQELEQPDAALTSLTPIHADLSDLQQRSYWIDIPDSGRVDIEAVGRSLQDLRLWRNGTDIADLSPKMSIFELKPGLPMSRATLTGTVEAGRYLVTAYGGQKLVWTSADAAEPFHIRTGAQLSLAGGIAENVIGPFGSIRFEAPADLDTFRLELPQSAPAVLRAGRTSQTATAFQSAVIDKASREPTATLSLSTDGQPSIVEVSGYEGQPFQLRGLRFGTETQFKGSVANLISLDIAGEGGDEIPATALLLRQDRGGKATIVASDLPHLGPGQAWRRRFNLRGPTSLLFEMTQAGQIAVRTSGVALHADISPVLVGNAPRVDGRNPDRFDLDAGYYLLRLLPDNNAVGIVDLTFGTPGLVPPVQPAAPARTTISFGIREAEKATRYQIIANAAPGLLTGPRAVALPADLQLRPLALWQPADAAAQPQPLPDQPMSNMPAPVPQAKGAANDDANVLSRPASPADLQIDVHVPPGGTIAAIDMHNTSVAFATSNERVDTKGRTLTLRFPVPSAARSIVVSWQPDAAAARQIAPPPPASPLIAGQPQFLDLAENAEKSYRLEVAEGGLYRIETLGRLQTSLRLGTSFLPGLGEASDNGDGHNALLQTYLRAGTYQVGLSVQNSSGHLGVAVTPASLPTAATLVADGTSRGILSGGRGAVVPIEITRAGSYQLDLYSLGEDLTARLEDAEGWPLTVPGPLSSLSQDFTPGHYRLVILPRDVDTRFVARLRPVIDAPQLQGHGPHPLAFNQSQAFQWREPQGKGDARVADGWTFDLLADADISIDLTEGMIGTLFRDDKEQIARFVAAPQFTGKLKAGHYRIDLTSLAHDDRLDYQVTLNTRDLQPGEARFVNLPAELSFNVETDRVVSLGTFGRTEIKGVLKDEHGAVLERLTGRSDDWNIALSTRLPAGSYTLALDQAAASGTAGSQADDNPDDQEADGDDQGEGDDQADLGDIEVQFALPQEQAQPALAESGSASVNGASVFIFPLPGPLPANVKDRLTLVAAQSTSDLVLSVEKRDADGGWKPQTLARGRTPFIAWPASEGDAQWRASVWTLDGGAAPIKIAARSIVGDMREPGDIASEPVAIDGLDLSLNVALAHAPSAGLMDLGASADLLAGASADRPLTAAASGLFAPQSDRLWLVSRGAGHVRVSPAQPDAEIALTLSPGDQAVIPAIPALPGKVRLWRADSAFGQPGLTAGRGMGVGLNSAVALSDNQDLHIWNAASDESLQMRLRPIDAAELEAVQLNGPLTTTVPAFSAQPVKLATGVKRLTLDLAPGIAVVSATSTSQLLNVWSAAAPLSRSIATSTEEIWLVNLTGDAGSARVSLSPGQAIALGNDQIKRRFFGTVGSEEIVVDAMKGDVLNVSGGAATFIGADGRVLRGESISVSGPGQLIVDHGAGLVALWLERGGQSPWPKPEPKSMTLPQSVKLEGEAMAFRLNPAQPMVLDVSTDAPVIVGLEQDGHRDMQLFPTGAEFHRCLAAGEAVLTLYSTHEGPLSGSLDMTATPVVPVNDGIGAPVVLAPGATALFGFEVRNSGNIGVGLRSDPDLAIGRLLDAKGQALGEGVNQLKQLAAGYYLLEARAPANAPTLIVRPSVVGLSPPPAGPPPEIINDYLQRAGLKPMGSK
ncbi:lysozyme inhibitor LprI family protein [Rhizobium redzepovicii]|uniref:lysozyme inhibitor LprI family protein n=1 Tax=Rhizobium redzepovicii TaxID=2867518 RepID=UPI001C934265|nr:lysozyme inhibitor LprI family protein [Rhizobium redzepovicii]MBY4612774.1 lysozyme inhibitor LprI family protein [Rhizobium redzepovicii]